MLRPILMNAGTLYRDYSTYVDNLGYILYMVLKKTILCILQTKFIRDDYLLDTNFK